MTTLNSPARASSTALGDAFIRAVHVNSHPSPLIDDPVSAKLLTEGEYRSLTSSVLRSERRYSGDGEPDEARRVHTWMTRHSAAAPHVILRARFTEEALRQAVLGGVRQYIILGAGFDTFALRRPAWAEAVRVVEVDLEATQQSKRERIDCAGLVSDAVYVAADFERDSLHEILGRVDSLDPAAPAFASLCGVSYYLGSTALTAVLASVTRAFPAGLLLVADYWDSALAVPDQQDQATRSMFASVARNGEPFRPCLLPATWSQVCREAGLAVHQDLAGPEYLSTLTGAADSMSPRPVGRLTAAASC